MYRFTVKTLFATVAAASVVCAVVFAFPPYVRIATLFVGILVLPGPLVVALRFGVPWVRAFALGALGAYSAWLIVVGIPIGWLAMDELGDMHGVSLSMLATEQGSGGVIGQPGVFITLDFYLLHAGLYAPWFVVPLGGASALVLFACGYHKRPACRDHASAATRPPTIGPTTGTQE